MLSILKSLLGYLARPRLYPELCRKLYKNIFNRKSAAKGKQEAEIWCAKRAVSQEEAIIKLTKSDYFVYKDFPEILKNAKQIEENTPVKMGGAGALDLIYALCEYTQAKNMLETGVAYGWSSLAGLLSLHKRNGTLYSSDMPYMGKNNDQYVGCVVPENLHKYWKLFRFADRESLPKIFKIQNSFEVAHYDSDKTYTGRMWAYPLIWEKISAGGFFISDDIGDNSAFMDWTIQNNLTPTIISFDEKFIGVIETS